MEAKIGRRRVPANLIEATPSAGGLWHWILASPALIFLLWSWISLFSLLSSIAWPMINIPIANIVLGSITFIVVIVLPLGYLVHRTITAMPRLFQNAGWEIYPLEPVREGREIFGALRFPGTPARSHQLAAHLATRGSRLGLS